MFGVLVTMVLIFLICEIISVNFLFPPNQPHESWFIKAIFFNVALASLLGTQPGRRKTIIFPSKSATSESNKSPISLSSEKFNFVTFSKFSSLNNLSWPNLFFEPIYI